MLQTHSHDIQHVAFLNKHLCYKDLKPNRIGVANTIHKENIIYLLDGVTVMKM